MEVPGVDFDNTSVTHYLGREPVTAILAPGMHPLRERLFVLLNHGAAMPPGSCDALRE